MSTRTLLYLSPQTPNVVLWQRLPTFSGNYVSPALLTVVAGCGLLLLLSAKTTKALVLHSFKTANVAHCKPKKEAMTAMLPQEKW